MNGVINSYLIVIGALIRISVVSSCSCQCEKQTTNSLSLELLIDWFTEIGINASSYLIISGSFIIWDNCI